jgi:hypothetical protein
VDQLLHHLLGAVEQDLLDERIDFGELTIATRPALRLAELRERAAASPRRRILSKLSGFSRDTLIPGDDPGKRLTTRELTMNLGTEPTSSPRNTGRVERRRELQHG